MKWLQVLKFNKSLRQLTGSRSTTSQETDPLRICKRTEKDERRSNREVKVGKVSGGRQRERGEGRENNGWRG